MIAESRRNEGGESASSKREVIHLLAGALTIKLGTQPSTINAGA